MPACMVSCIIIYSLIYYTFSSRLHVQIVQVCFIGMHVPWWWFAASIALSSTLGISSNAIPPSSTLLLSAIPPLAPHPQAPVCDVPLPVSMCSHCLTTTYEWECAVFGFLFLCQFAENDGFQLHPCPYKGHELILFYGCIVFHGVYMPDFLYSVCDWWAFGLVPSLRYCEQCHNIGPFFHCI